MREKWARLIVLLTGLLVLLLAATFAVMQNPIESADTTENTEQTPAPEHLKSIVLDPKHIEAGRQIYKQQTCARCHSIAEEGNPRNPLDGVGAKRSAKELRDWIIGADSLQNKLPERAFKLKQVHRTLPGDDLDALVFYMQSLRP